MVAEERNENERHKNTQQYYWKTKTDTFEGKKNFLSFF